MAWIHCLNCGWQGEIAYGKAERLGGAVLMASGMGVGIALQNWGIGIGLFVAGLLALLVGLGAKKEDHCPRCQSSLVEETESPLKKSKKKQE